MHSLPPGAVPMVPKNGRIGTSTLPILLLGMSTVAVLRALSICQMNRRSGAGCVTIAVLYSGASRPKPGIDAPQPQSRLGSTLSRCTTSVSPGSAPSTENGPVCGLTLVRSSLGATVLSETEKASFDASRVLVTTVSPGLMRAAGG